MKFSGKFSLLVLRFFFMGEHRSDRDPWNTNSLPYPFPKQAFVFSCLQYKSLENTVGKKEIACIKQFLLFPQCFFYSYEELSDIFIKFKIVFCTFFSVWKSKKFVVWERLILFKTRDICII